MIATRIRRKVNFCRQNGLLSIAVLCACLAGAVSLAAFQRRAPHRLRAIALLEIKTGPTGTVSTNITPIAILDNKRFHDAAIYEPRPRPMAIADGVVYEAQKTGMPVGYATIIGAQKNQGQWTVLARWQPGAEIDPSRPKAAAVAPPPGSDRPILRRPGSTATPPASATPAPAGTSAPAPAAAPGPVESTPEDPDRPKLRRQPDSVPATPVAPPAGAKPAGGSPVPAKPLTPSLSLSMPGLHTLVAVSDAEATHTRSYEYIWKAGEQQEAEARLRKLAIAQLPVENRKGPPPELTNVVIRSFDLDLSNDAVLVLTAEVPPVPPVPAAKGAPAAPGKPVSRYVALIVRLNFEGALVKLAASVTDSSRLDVAPRLEFIDAVDADGAGPAELLFREYSFDQKSFVIYGIGRTTVTTMFEGAGQPLP